MPRAIKQHMVDIEQRCLLSVAWELGEDGTAPLRKLMAADSPYLPAILAQVCVHARRGRVLAQFRTA